MLVTIATAVLVLLSMGLGAWMTLFGSVLVCIAPNRASAMACVAVAIIGLALFVGTIAYAPAMFA